MMVTKVLAKGKRLRLAMASQEGIIVRYRLKEAEVQSYEHKPAPDLIRGTEIAYKAEHPGMSQPHMTKPRVLEIG